MLPIYICEDNLLQLNQYKSVIENLILMEEFDVKIQAAVTQPEELLFAVEKYQKQTSNSGFYLLDIELNSTTDGFELAKRIREFDSRGFIVFITTHSELAPMTFKYQLEAMDFIAKEDVWNIGIRIRYCLNTALKRYQSFSKIPMITFKSGSHTTYIEQDSILYITVAYTPHKIQVVTTNSSREFYGTLKGCMKDLSNHFIRCHKGYIVNTDHIENVDRKECSITLTNGETLYASTHGIAQVVALLCKSKQ